MCPLTHRISCPARTTSRLECIRKVLNGKQLINTSFLTKRLVSLRSNPSLPGQLSFIPLEEVRHLSGAFIEHFCNTTWS